MPTLTDPYASHLPVLLALSRLLPMRRVLEFGAGLHSTPFFLELPDLEQLVSIESDPEWRARVALQCDDPRLILHSGDDRALHLMKFDLVFIDDGKSAQERRETISWVLEQPHPPVVIHDAEVPEYREAIEESGSPWATLHWGTPWTALVWS